MSVTAERFLARLEAHRSPEKQASYERSLRTGAEDRFLGVGMGEVFALAKEFVDMPLDEIEALLESSIHEARVGALSVMDKQARRARTSGEQRKALFELYLRRMDRIDGWDLVDVAATHVMGRYLFDKQRDPLYELARSGNPWARRTAIVATLYLVRRGEVTDTLKLAQILAADKHEYVRRAAGGLLREVGKADQDALLRFLGENADDMPRAVLRTAVERLDPSQRARYLERAAA